VQKFLVILSNLSINQAVVPLGLGNWDGDCWRWEFPQAKTIIKPTNRLLSNWRQRRENIRGDEKAAESGYRKKFGRGTAKNSFAVSKNYASGGMAFACAGKFQGGNGVCGKALRQGGGGCNPRRIFISRQTPKNEKGKDCIILNGRISRRERRLTSRRKWKPRESRKKTRE